MNIIFKLLSLKRLINLNLFNLCCKSHSLLKYVFAKLSTFAKHSFVLCLEFFFCKRTHHLTHSFVLCLVLQTHQDKLQMKLRKQIDLNFILSLEFFFCGSYAQQLNACISYKQVQVLL